MWLPRNQSQDSMHRDAVHPEKASRSFLSPSDAVPEHKVSFFKRTDSVGSQSDAAPERKMSPERKVSFSGFKRSDSVGSASSLIHKEDAERRESVSSAVSRDIPAITAVDTDT